jgi:protein ImuB
VTALSFHRAASGAPRRYLALWFQFLPAERQVKLCGVQDEPLVLTEKAGNALRLAAVSRIAAGMGLTPGLTLADARAVVPALVAVEADRAADARLLNRIALWCDRFTPLVALEGAQGLTLDITGCAALFGGEAALRRAALMGLKRLGFSAQGSIAGTPDAAVALARFGRVAIVPEGGEAKATSGLPLDALQAGEEATRALFRAGLRTIGDLAARPSATLRSRFTATLMQRLDRICGREDTRLTPLRALPDCHVDRRFAEPLKHEAALSDVLKEMMYAAFAELERRGEGGRAFEVRFFRTDGEIQALSVETGRPSRDAAAILTLFAERMAALADPIDPGFGFDAMRLNVLRTEALGATQQGFERGDTGETALADLVDRLIARFGRARVLGLQPQDTHMPERAAIRVTAGLPEKHAAWPSGDAAEPPSRPLQMFDPPQRIDVPLAQFPDGPPGRFRWRRVVHDVAAAEGPERIAPEWWRSGEETRTRDYYRVEDREGRRFWIYRRGLYGRETSEPEWFLHGLFA